MRDRATAGGPNGGSEYLVVPYAMDQKAFRHGRLAAHATAAAAVATGFATGPDRRI